MKTLTSINVFVTNQRGGIVERGKAASVEALAQYLVASGAKFDPKAPRVGFTVERSGQSCRIVFQLDREGAGQWGWRYVWENVYPVFERLSNRQERISKLVVVKPVPKRQRVGA